MVLAGEIAVQFRRRNVYCTKEIAYFPSSVTTFTVDGNALNGKKIRQPSAKSMLE